jgi:hypothetical protein
MKKISIPAFILVAATLSACGSNFEWFPDYVDTIPPTVNGTVGGISFSNSTTIYPSLPGTASLYGTDNASLPVTIYYTTNGSTASTSANLYSESFTVADSSWILSIIGKDNAGNISEPVTVKLKK